MTAEAEAAATAPEQAQTTEAPGGASSLLGGDALYPAETPQETEQPADAAAGNQPETEAGAEGVAETKSGDQPNGSGESIDSGDDIAAVNEWIAHVAPDADQASQIVVPVKKDGQTVETSLYELVDSYQKSTAADRRLDEARQIKASATDELAAKTQRLDGQFATVAKLIDAAEKVVDRDSANINWQQLRQDDPAEYSARKAEVAERRQEIDKLKNDAVGSYQEATAEQQQESSERLKTYLATEREALLSAIPEWRNQDKATAERTELVTYLSQSGFDQKDIMGATDHRLVLMARKAMLYDKAQTKVDAAKKKLTKVPKVLKPGAGSDTKTTPKPKDAASILYG